MKDLKDLKKCFMSVLVLMIFCILAAGSSETDPNAWKTEDNSMMAYIMMEDFIPKYLKSPSSVKFPGFLKKDLHTTFLGNCTYRIRSYVDSQNSFGAMIRTWFTGEIKQISADRWQLVSLKFDES